MNYDIPTGTEVAGSFRIRRVHKATVMSDMSNPVVDATVVELDSLYENAAFLSFFTFQGSLPPPDKWTNLVFKPSDENIRIFPMWRPSKIQQVYVCIPYKIRSASGNLVAVTEMLAAKSKTVVSAKLTWWGFPGINTFFVGFKPGMKERTEDLLLAGLAMV